MTAYIIISGCSGGGKSAILEALRVKGHKVVPEAGRRVAQDENARASGALPWVNMPLFLERAIEMAARDYETAETQRGPVFFDRSLIDLILAYEHATGRSKYHDYLIKMRYASKVYFTPPWPEIFANDAERRHSLAEAVSEYKRLERGYPNYGYDIQLLPRTSVEVRAQIILDDL